MQSANYQNVIEGLQRLKDSAAASLAVRILQGGFALAVVLFLAHKLEAVGWRDVLASLPNTPWFYLFFAIMYFAYPVAEQVVYRLIWGVDTKRHTSVFLRMRVYNFAVLSYSGEAFLGLWARKNLKLRSGQIFSSIKDSNILSSLASNSFTIILLVSLFATNQLHFITDANADFRLYLALAFLVGIILVPAVIHFRKHILSLEGAKARRVFLVHLTRQIIVLLAQTAMWTVALPEVPVNGWLLLLTAQMVLTRIPFLPNTDLLLAGLGLSLMAYMAAPEAKLAGMFFAAGVLSQIFNVVVFVFASLPLSPTRQRAATENA